jgi:hypothetical protein
MAKYEDVGFTLTSRMADWTFEQDDVFSDGEDMLAGNL